MESMDNLKQYLDALIEQADRVRATSALRQGRKPFKRFTRAELELQFSRLSADMSAASSRHHIRTTTIGDEYPPSQRTLSTLEPILLSDLVLETHHRGRVLVARIFGWSRRISGVQSALEDHAGNVEQIAIYNTDPARSPDIVLPRLTVFALKEPYYKSTADGRISLRVDHPSDLVELKPGHPLIPPQWGLISSRLSADHCKEQGNESYKRGDVDLAFEMYTQGLECCGVDCASLRHDLLRNRALMCIRRGQYEQAQQDAEQAVITQSQRGGNANICRLNVKAYYHAGTASYNLRNFSEAVDLFQKALDLDAEDKGSNLSMKRAMQRLDEERNGSYDFKNIHEGLSRMHSRVDCADFLTKTEIRTTTDAGRGLVATTNIAAGEVILCEKAFAIAFNSDSTTDICMVLNVNTKRGSFGSHSALMNSLVQKLRNNPGLAHEYFGLYDGGGYSGRPQCPIIDGCPVVDTFRVQRICELNRFGTDTGSNGIPQERTTSVPLNARLDVDKAVGIWIRASYMNHSCLGNAARAFLGDLMVVRAVRNIKQGEEILIPYRRFDPDQAKNQEDLQRTWGFTCKCLLCAAEASCTQTQRNARSKVLESVESFLSRNPVTARGRPEKGAISRAERLYQGLEATYDKNVFKDVPRLGLMKIGIWLCQAYSLLPGMAERELSFASSLLNEICPASNGEVARGNIRGACFGLEVADVAMYASQAAMLLNRQERALKLKSLAKHIYTCLTGGVWGFDDRYG